MVFFRSRAAHRDGNSTRGRQGPVDYDVFEGLPVRRWARQNFVVSQTLKSCVDVDGGRTGWMQDAAEMPMPKDSHLLSPTSRALLNSARTGCKYIKAPERSNRDGDDAKDTKGVNGSIAVPFARTFTVGKWAVLPRHMEPLEPEYLAKRRSNFVPMTSAVDTGDEGISSANTRLRRTQFKRADPVTGAILLYDAAVPEGHIVEGEVSTTEPVGSTAEEKPAIATPSPGTVIEGVGIVDQEGLVIANVDEVLVTPVPRRRFPPKRRLRGPGRGKRKKVMFVHGRGHDIYSRESTRPVSSSGLTNMTMPGANGSSAEPEDHSTPTFNDDDLDFDGDGDGDGEVDGENYEDESEEDIEMDDKPEEEMHDVESIREGGDQQFRVDAPPTAFKPEPELEEINLEDLPVETTTQDAPAADFTPQPKEAKAGESPVPTTPRSAEPTPKLEEASVVESCAETSPENTRAVVSDSESVEVMVDNLPAEAVTQNALVTDFMSEPEDSKVYDVPVDTTPQDTSTADSLSESKEIELDEI
ncbi:hypothetical protein KEM54_002965, partial [Ascosphaera aggregata]